MKVILHHYSNYKKPIKVVMKKNVKNYIKNAKGTTNKNFINWCGNKVIGAT